MREETAKWINQTNVKYLNALKLIAMRLEGIALDDLTHAEKQIFEILKGLGLAGRHENEVMSIRGETLWERLEFAQRHAIFS